MYHLSWCWE